MRARASVRLDYLPEAGEEAVLLSLRLTADHLVVIGRGRLTANWIAVTMIGAAILLNRRDA